ncbi:MAG TPA: ATP-binding protein [Acidimicrobiales bacterium]|nr:ATP-binding protein [Acidimicrobiales bacterium]
MNKRDNPFTPGAGRKPRTLAGRDEDIEAFQSLVERLEAGSYERSLVYTGLRGVGKTVLLMEFDVLASEAGWATTDVQEVGSSPDFRITFARMAARLLMNMSRRHRAKQRLERALAVVKAFSVAVPGAVELRLDVEAASGVADSGDPEQDLAGLLHEIGEVAQANRMGALFLIDEMQNLDGSALGAICMAFQAVSRAGLPVTMVAAGLPDLRVRLLAAKPYADRLFSYAELGRLSDAAARAALIGPAISAGVHFAEEAAREIVRESAGFPYFLQEYGRELWNFAESSPISMDDLRAARGIVQDSLARNFFGTRFEMATDAEQRYLVAMASLGSGPYPVSAVARAFGADDQRRVSVHRDSLIGKGLIWSPRRGQVDFTVPLFAEYLAGTVLDS